MEWLRATIGINGFPMVFDGCAPLVRRSNGYVPSLKSIIIPFFWFRITLVFEQEAVVGEAGAGGGVKEGTEFLSSESLINGGTKPK